MKDRFDRNKLRMFKTGIIFIDAFSSVCTFLPLLPVAFIFIKKIYYKEALNLLMILCLFNFIENIILMVPQSISTNQNAIAEIFSLVELILLLQIFKSVLPGKLKQIVNVFLIAFLSAIITFYSLQGMSEKRINVEIIQDGIIIAVIAIGLFDLITNSSLHIFRIPLFWIAAGSLFYFAMSILLNIFTDPILKPNAETTADSILISDIVNLIRYTFYIFAVIFYLPEKNLNKDSSLN
jgi:hypothetical protein